MKRIALLTLAVLLATGVAAAGDLSGRKIIQYGPEFPDTELVREHLHEMEKVGFDGVVVRAARRGGTREDSENWSMGYKLFSRERLDFKDAEGAIADLNAARSRFVANSFIQCDASLPGDVDWFDPEWSAVPHNAAVMARIAKLGGCKGLMIDPEEYGSYHLWSYQKLPAELRARHTFQEYRAQVRKCGREFIEGINSEYPDITLLFLLGPSFALQRIEVYGREKASYSLLADFFDGMCEAAAPGVVLVDGYEQSYIYRRRSFFQQGRRYILEQSRDISAVPEAFAKHVRAGFGVCLDEDSTVPWAAKDYSACYFTPDEFRNSLACALDASDEFVWTWSGKQPHWFSDCNIPVEYLQALKLAKQGPVSVRERVHEEHAPKASTLGGYSDAETFARFSGKMTEVLDLPKEGWRFRLDPDDRGQSGRWYLPEFDDSGWRTISIGDFWESQGVNYDGDAWYRRVIDAPELPPAKRAYLVFGAVDESARVYVNGEYVGGQDIGEAGWDKPFRVDVTGTILPGKPNAIAVFVQDTGRFGGIWKSVKLMVDSEWKSEGPGPLKSAAAFCGADLVKKAQANAARYPWAAKFQQEIVQAAQPWAKMSDDELWDLMFGPTIPRSWMVWSDGYCPACKATTNMYAWEIDALNRPWKVRCPSCGQVFPTNDFGRFYESGLDEHHIFDPKRADRSLLFNTEHPDPNDPLHNFGVDDGAGYSADGHNWRFIGAYLVHGQWKQAVVDGICKLAAAYTATGDLTYAHKAAILLDRVADLYPGFDFNNQSVAYEKQGNEGYVSVWHDACFEAHDLAVAYDQIFEGARDDKSLPAFLSRKAAQYKLDNPKASFADIQRNIEDRIFRDTLAHRYKIASNPPQTDITMIVIKTVLGWPANREEILSALDTIVDKSTAVDGTTGEKGLAGYGALSPRYLADIFGMYMRTDPAFLRDLYRRNPRLSESYRFFIDTWCANGAYYPSSGDCGAVGVPRKEYAGLTLDAEPQVAPSGFVFLWKLYELTKDPAFVQVLYHANGDSLDGLPHDLFADDPAAFQQAVKQVIDREGKTIKLASVNKQEWHLAVLRAGSGDNERDLVLDYDAGGGHAHSDGMNIELFAKGLELLPDFGYVLVHYGGWQSDKSYWYRMTAAHETVLVAGSAQDNSETDAWMDRPRASGKTTLWADSSDFHAIRASCPEMIGGPRIGTDGLPIQEPIKDMPVRPQFERTVALVDVSDSDSYVIDVFRVAGGKDHSKFTHGYFGTMTTQGLSLTPTQLDYGPKVFMRNFSADAAPPSAWSADWKVEDFHKLLKKPADLHLRYTDLTAGAQALTADTWVVTGPREASVESWLPTVIVRRKSDKGPLASCFVSVMEPYENKSSIAGIRRLALETPDGRTCPDGDVALEVKLADGRTHLFAATDTQNPLLQTPADYMHTMYLQKDSGLRLDGEMCLIGKSAGDEVESIVLCHGRSVQVGDALVIAKPDTDFVEVKITGGRAEVVAGPRDAVEDVIVRGKSVWL